MPGTTIRTTAQQLAPLLEMARAAAMESERAVLLPRGARETARLLGALACEIWLVDDGLPSVAAVHLEPEAEVSRLDGAALLATLVAGSGAGQQIDGWLCVPIPGDPGPLGALAVHGAGPWQAGQIALAETAAAIVGLGVQLTRARRFDDRERDQFLALVGHDLRSPLSNVRVGAQLARRNLEAGDTDSARQALEIIEHQSARLLDRLQALLEAVAAAGRWLIRLGPLDLGALAETVVAPYRMAAMESGVGTTFEVLVDTAAQRARGDAGQIAQVIEQLVDNAAKYAAGGHVSVAVSMAGAAVRLDVCDDGPGIRPEDVERVFAPFSRGAAASGKDGYGLGLYLARNIVVAHGGQLKVGRTSRSGTCMTMTLPAARPEDT